MLEQNAEKWGDKVKIFGLSIDQDVNSLKSKVTDKNWLKPIQLHARNGTCKADKMFSFRGIPFCVLIDTEGKIVFQGHPASR